MQIVVGVSDAKVSADQGAELVTYALGSCVGVTLYDPILRIAGMLHYQLPSSTDDPARAVERPFMYADTGMSWIISAMEKLGANKRRLRVRIAGAAQILQDNQMFDIGRRNHVAIRKLLWKWGMFIDTEHVGGSFPRTLFMNVKNGSLNIKCNQQVIALS